MRSHKGRRQRSAGRGPLVAAGGLLLALALVCLNPHAAMPERAPNEAVATALSGAVAGVYDRLEPFQAAVARLEPMGTGEPAMPEPIREARRRAVARSIARVAPHDRSGLEAVAQRLGLLIYNPNLSENEPRSLEGDVTLSRPIQIWDSAVKEYGFSGTVQWREPKALYGDWPGWGSAIGGPDGVGMLFSSIADLSLITSVFASQADALGRYQGGHGTLSLTAGATPQWAYTLRLQDTWLGAWYGYCSCWRITTDIWMKPGAFGSGARNVYLYYAHDWKQTQINGISFAGNGGANTQQLGMGLTISWSTATEKWAVQSLYTAY